MDSYSCYKGSFVHGVKIQKNCLAETPHILAIKIFMCSAALHYFKNSLLSLKSNKKRFERLELGIRAL